MSTSVGKRSSNARETQLEPSSKIGIFGLIRGPLSDIDICWPNQVEREGLQAELDSWESVILPTP
jgi:hypothetical protein